MRWSHTLIAGLLLVLGMHITAAAEDKASAAATDEISAVRAAWQKRFDMSRSWKCVADAELVTPKGQAIAADDPELSPSLAAFLKVAGSFPFADTPRPHPFVLHVDRQAGLRRIEKTSTLLDAESLKYESTRKVGAEDGTVVWREVLNPENANWMRTIDLSDQQPGGISYIYSPNYFAHGLFSFLDEGIDWKHPEKSSAKGLKLVSAGTGEIAGTSCLRIQIPGRAANYSYFVYVDPKRDYAILRWESISSEGIHCAVDVTDYRLQDGLYLPYRWQADHFNGGGFVARKNAVIVQKFIVKVKSYEINPRLDKTLFEIPNDGDVVIRDQRQKKK